MFGDLIKWAVNVARTQMHSEGQSKKQLINAPRLLSIILSGNICLDSELALFLAELNTFFLTVIEFRQMGTRETFYNELL